VIIHTLFFPLVIICLPLSVLLSIKFQRFMNFMFIVMILSTSFLHRLEIFYFSDEYQRRATPGFEISLTFLCALSLFITMFFKKERVQWIPMTSAFLLFFLMGTISWIATDSKIPSFEFLGDGGTAQNYYNVGLYPLFELITLFQGYFIFFVTAQFLKDKDRLKAFLTGLMYVIIFHTCIGLKGRYIDHQHRVGWYFGHANNFGNYVGMVGAFFAPFIFAPKSWKYSLKALFFSLCGLAAVILSISRSSIASYFLIGSFATIICIIHFPKIRNFIKLFLLCFILSLFVAKSYNTIMERFSTKETIEGGLEARKTQNYLAKLMVNDHPLGVGLGNFTAYSFSKYAKFAPGEIAIRPHNIWILTLAETGYTGFIAYALLWLRYLQLSCATLIKSKTRRNSTLFMYALGVFCSFLFIQSQNFFHFTLQDSAISFFLYISMGVMVRIYMDAKIMDPNVPTLFNKVPEL
jgi:O-antigen ligase